MYGLGGGGSGPYFFQNWPLPLTGWGFFACSGPVSHILHHTPTAITPTYGHMRVKSFVWICCICCVEDMCNMGPLKTLIC